jgi:hypothetical protein
MKTKYTPGPWHQCDAHGPVEYGTCAMDSNGTMVASCTGYFGRDGAIANTRLIAAAPELLEALLAVVGECSGPQRPYSSDSYLPEQFIAVARAAIAKATGSDQ